jgi:CheY-like chemotaxis protein
MIERRPLHPAILVVEDEQPNRDLLVRLLSGQGYNVDSVADGEGALKTLQEQRCDLVLLDVRLPGTRTAFVTMPFRCSRKLSASSTPTMRLRRRVRTGQRCPRSTAYEELTRETEMGLHREDLVHSFIRLGRAGSLNSMAAAVRSKAASGISIS